MEPKLHAIIFARSIGKSPEGDTVITCPWRRLQVSGFPITPDLGGIFVDVESNGQPGTFEVLYTVESDGLPNRLLDGPPRQRVHMPEGMSISFTDRPTGCIFVAPSRFAVRVLWDGKEIGRRFLSIVVEEFTK